MLNTLQTSNENTSETLVRKPNELETFHHFSSEINSSDVSVFPRGH